MSKTCVTGLTVKARSGSKFTLTWGWSFKKSGDSVTEQKFIYHLMWKTVKNGVATNGGQNYTVAVSKSAKSKAVNIDLSSFNGKTKILTKIEFIVSMKTKKTSGWQLEDVATWEPSAPKASSLSFTKELVDTYSTRFTWRISSDTSGKNPVDKIEYQSYAFANIPTTTTSGLNSLMDTQFSTGGSSSTMYTNLNTSKLETETGVLSGSSVCRVARVRAIGWGGATNWKTLYTLYAQPLKSEGLVASVTKQSSGLYVKMAFNAPNTAARKIDQIQAQWLIATPLADMEAPTTGWETGKTIKDVTNTSGSGTYYTSSGSATNGYEHNVDFIIADTIGLDECLFVRVVTTYGTEANQTDAIIPTGGYGNLTMPSLVIDGTYDTTHSAVLTVTNNSAVPDAKVAIFYEDQDSEATIIGITSSSGQNTYTCPDWTDKTPIAFGVYGFVGSYYAEDGYFNISSILMQSAGVSWEGGSVPSAPENITLESTETTGVLKVTWDWNWDLADQAEVSWSEYMYAWDSTDPPSTFTIYRANGNSLFITDLETGVPIYVRVRFIKGYGDNAVYSPFSETHNYTLESAPDIPSLDLSKYVIAQSDETKASWVYVSKDNSEQSSAEIAEYDGSSYTTIMTVGGGDQYVMLDGSFWNTGTSHQLCVRVWSSKGQCSEWSQPVTLAIADPLTCTISNTSLVTEEVDVDGDTVELNMLKALPLNVTVTGAGDTATTTLIIRRAEAFHIERPNEEMFDGYAGETIAIYSHTGDAQFVIDDNALMFDDEAKYTIVATVSDEYGQSASDSIDFTVGWTHQAVMPSGTVTMMGTAARIVPRADYTEGDTVDIYRLSADNPELILSGGTFNTVYVDPYPAMGEHGGYRIVYKTVNGDYKTANGTLAWVDVPTNFTSSKALIDFNGIQIPLYYNVDESNGWEKDFVQTKYLGGSVQGNWNVGVKRNASISTVAISILDQEMIDNMRALASYAGVCHVRTLSGSSYDADIQVSETNSHDRGGKVLEYSLTVTKVDASGNDAVLYTEWQQ